MRRKAMSRKKLLLWLALAMLVAAGVLSAPLLWVRYQQTRAVAALRQDDLDGAFEHLQSAEQTDPSNAETLFWLARVHRRLGRLKEMEDYLERAEGLGFPKKRLQRERWLAWAQSGQLHRATPHLSALLRDPGEDGPEICRAFVTGYCLHLEFRPALALLDVWQADYPDDPAAHFLRGRLWFSQQQWEWAADAYRQGLETAAERFQPRLRLAHSLLMLKRPADAEPQFRQCLQADPDNLEALTGLANSLIDLGRLDEARQVLTQALQRDRDHFEARRLMGQLELAAGRPHRTIEWVKPLVDEWPDGLAVCYLLAQAYQTAGEQSNAERFFERVQSAQQALDRIGRLTEEISQRPRDVDLRCQLGRLVMRYHSRGDGVAWLRSALLIEPEHRSSHAALAEHYAASGQQELAERHRRQAEAAEIRDD